MAKFRLDLGAILNTIETRWSLFNLVQGTGYLASFGLPAWAAKTAKVFAQYAPLSWITAGFFGLIIWAVANYLLQKTNTMKIRAKYDARLLEQDFVINPLDSTFERKRISITNLALPSHPNVDGKTFIDCELVGPGNIYFPFNNQAFPIKPPIFDAVWLAPNAKFQNGITFTNCIFRNCSFQNITMFASIENYHQWKTNLNINWIGIPPSEADIEERIRSLNSTTPTTESAKLAPVKESIADHS